MNDRNEQQQSRDAASPRQRQKDSKSGDQKRNASAEASRAAKRGEPSSADRPRERSPKQENL
jgi:hypothetical protein